MGNIAKWFVDRAKEKTTWYGIVALISAAGIAISPELKESVAVAGMAIAGLLATITKDAS